MAGLCSVPALSLFLLLALLLLSLTSVVRGKRVSFFEDFRVTWSGSHIKQLEDGGSIQLSLDQSSGSGFASKNRYMFGRVSMRIKLVPGDSAGTVTTFYMSSDNFAVRDELDFEFLGNRSGQRVNLWLDPSADFHTYSILWNHRHVVPPMCARISRDDESRGWMAIDGAGRIQHHAEKKAFSIFFVDDTPIRVFKNNRVRGVPYPDAQPMGVYSSLWNADNWATRGGLEKIDWSKAPFYTYYRDFDIEGCGVPGPSGCIQDPKNGWEAPESLQLSPVQARKYRWVRVNHMVYDYCTDKRRNPVPPPECTAGI